MAWLQPCSSRSSLSSHPSCNSWIEYLPSTVSLDIIAGLDLLLPFAPKPISSSGECTDNGTELFFSRPNLCPAVSSSASAWPGPWPLSPRFCFWMNHGLSGLSSHQAHRGAASGVGRDLPHDRGFHSLGQAGRLAHAVAVFSLRLESAHRLLDFFTGAYQAFVRMPVQYQAQAQDAAAGLSTRGAGGARLTPAGVCRAWIRSALDRMGISHRTGTRPSSSRVWASLPPTGQSG